MKTKEVSEKLGITPKALRTYEAYEIVVPKRAANGYRTYDEEDLLRLREVMLLKEMGFTLREIKLLTDKNIYANNRFARSLYLQCKAIESKLDELEKIKRTLKESIDRMLESDKELDYEHFLENIADTLKQNMAGRRQWMDKWGFDNRAMKFDRMVKDRTDDELGLFEQYEEILAEIRGLIADRHATSVLDIGCGTGNLCGSLASQIKVVGMDQSLEMLLQAKKKYGSMELKLGNFLDKPYWTNRFDVVVTTFAFHALHEEEKKIALNHMLQYLREGGKVIIADFMFLTEREKEKCKEKLLAQGKEALWEVIDSRYYTIIDRFAAHVQGLGLRIKYRHLVNFSWLMEIEPSQSQGMYEAVCD